MTIPNLDKDPTGQTWLLQKGLQAAGYTLKADNWRGAITEDALAAFERSIADAPHAGKASSFADPADIAAFKRCKARGNSDIYCFGYGDNGIGCWGDDTTTLSEPIVAVPPDDMVQRFGSVADAKHAKLDLTIGEKTVRCVVKDRMPWKRNITNGGVIDLAPGAQKAFGLKPPFMVDATWEWA
jgi:hypothetical protein